MMIELRYGSCYPKALIGVNVALTCVDAAISAFAFYLLIRIQARNLHLGWTRQKVFHLMIGSSNLGDGVLAVRTGADPGSICWVPSCTEQMFFVGLGYVVYFVLSLIAACKDWLCWSQSCGFIVMACPKILFLAAFLLLLSFCVLLFRFRLKYLFCNPSLVMHVYVLDFPCGESSIIYRVDLCHQANDEDDEDDESSPREALLERESNKPHSNAESHRRCCYFRTIHVGSRQRVVILVTAMIFILMITFAILIWIGMGRNPIDSELVARVYVDLFSIAILLLGGALACYGLLLFLKMRKVRSERASSEMWKVAGLAIVSVLSFTSSALVALFTDIPMLYHWHHQHVDAVFTSLLLILYYFIGSSVPSAYVLWVMRELPPSIAVNVVEESRTITFIHDSSATINPQRWTAATSLQNQVSRASPI